MGSISVDARRGIVTLQNNTGILSPRDLLQGHTGEEKLQGQGKNRNIAGKFGDGLQASINVLLTRGLELQLWSNGYRYHFDYRPSPGDPDKIETLQ